MASAPVRSPSAAAAAARSNWSVTLAMALTTTTGLLPPAARPATIAAVRPIAAGSSTDVPPNFITTRFISCFPLIVCVSPAGASAIFSYARAVATGAGSSLPRLASISAFKIVAPAAPRTVLCESSTNFQSSRLHGRSRPTVTVMPLPRPRSRRGCGRSFCSVHSIGCSGADGKSEPCKRPEICPRRQNVFARRLASQLPAQLD